MSEKTRVILLTIVMAAIIAVIAFAASGCATAGSPAAKAIAATGSGVDQVTAYVKAADGAVKSAGQHADAAGQALLGQASANHTSALTELTAVKTDLGQVTAAVNQLEHANANLQAQVNSLTGMVGYRIEVWAIRLFWVLVGLVAAHFILGALAIILPPPYSTISGLISKIVNPFGWFTWVVVEFEKNVAAKVPQTVQLVHG